jgi:hypothetical protein
VWNNITYDGKLAYTKDSVLIKYKTTPHAVISLTPTETGPVVLPKLNGYNTSRQLSKAPNYEISDTIDITDPIYQ